MKWRVNRKQSNELNVLALLVPYINTISRTRTFVNSRMLQIREVFVFFFLSNLNFFIGMKNDYKN